jgi:hypothetical protein
METSTQTFHAYCACGRTEHEALGAPVVALACYCDDCQAAAGQIDAMPEGKSGLGADGGTISVLFRKDRVRCVRGQELLVGHKLRADSDTTRMIASCCNSNVLTRFDNWLPIVALRTFAREGTSIAPQISIYTKFAPELDKIVHAAPRHAKMPPSLGMKVLANAVQLGFRRVVSAPSPGA